MGQALYRKYRSKTLSEIVGQDHITTTLANALKSGRISHAYLFTGPRGVGKTSIARILAHEVNGLPYETDNNHLDIIEIDAASNRRIDEIRDLREKVHIAPTTAKYKVYIIDEVHMLTKEAFNALLKTLEEPPQHVIFILATTEAHKLPETIISRTQRFTFKPVSVQQVVDHLKYIAKQEGITVSDEALQLIAEHGEGSFRDSISLLDQASSTSSKVKLRDVQTMLGIAPGDAIESLLSSLSRSDSIQLIADVRAMRMQGIHPAAIAKQLGITLREQAIAQQLVIPHELASALMRHLLAVPSAHDPEAYLEIILLETTLALPSSTESKSEPNPELTPVADKPKKNTTSKKSEPIDKESVAIEAAYIEPTAEPEPIVRDKPKNNDEFWQLILNTVKQRHNTLYGVLRMAHPEFAEGKLILRFGFPFHQKRINDSKNRVQLAAILQQLSDNEYEIVAIYEKGLMAPSSASSLEVESADSSQLDTITNIFGGAEVL